MRDIRLIDAPFDPNAVIDALAMASSDVGGIASFVGKVRAGTDVEALELSHYAPLTLPGMHDLADRALGRFSLIGLVMVHRIGLMHPGEPIVCVSAAAHHRRDAIAAVDFCMDHLKSAAWFWKREKRAKENGDSEWHWIEPRDEDHADLARWQA